MSIEAMKWVLNEACWYDDQGAMQEVPAHLIPLLQSLANQADEYGKGAYPSQGTMAWNSRKSERAVRKDLVLALELRLIRLGDQRLVEHYPADARPVVYDLAMELCRPARRRGRNHSTSPHGQGTGTTVPPPAGQLVPPGPDGPEPQDRAEPQFPPEPQDRSSGSGPEHMDRNHSSARRRGTGTTVPAATGTTVPPTRPSTQMMNSSSSPDPQSLVDKHARAVAIIRRHLPDADDEEAAALAESIRTAYGVGHALLGAYVRRMALAGDLAPALAEHRARAAGAPPAPRPGRPASLIALDQRAQQANVLQGDARRSAVAQARANSRPRKTRTGRPTPADRDPPAGGPDSPATAAS